MTKPGEQPIDTTAEEIPDAAGAPPVEFPALRIGEPFAIAHDCDFVSAKEGGGCTIVLRCDCSQLFRIDLLLAGPKYCPGCRQAYSHVLLAAPADDATIVGEAMEVVLVGNGIEPPPELTGGAGGDDEEDDDDDEDEEDEEDEDEDEDDEQPNGQGHDG